MLRGWPGEGLGASCGRTVLACTVVRFTRSLFHTPRHSLVEACSSFLIEYAVSVYARAVRRSKSSSNLRGAKNCGQHVHRVGFAASRRRPVFVEAGSLARM